MKIMDVFYLRDSEGNEIKVGNRCIELFVKNNAISNLTEEQYEVLKRILKIRKVCCLCGKKSTKQFHKNCLKRLAKAVNPKKRKNAMKDLIENIDRRNLEEKYDQILKDTAEILGGVKTIRDAIREERKSLKTFRAIQRLRENYSLIIENKNKLLALKKNCIVESIRTQWRTPSPKQMLMIDRIIQDYDRMLKIDEEGTNATYLKYGFVYRRM
jgi:hypothetical protein